jgi:hydrogenase expression/formation protein HypC
VSGGSGKIISISDAEPHANWQSGLWRIVKEVNLAYVPEAHIGDYVLVHVGFAISVGRNGSARGI